MSDGVFILELGAGDAPTASALGLELLSRGGLHIAGRGHGEDQWIVIDEIFDVEFARIDLEARPARFCEGLANLAKLIDDDLAEPGIITEDRLEFGDRRLEISGLLLEVGSTQPGQTAELHVENVVGLDLRERHRLATCGWGDTGHEGFTRCAPILTRPDGGDDLVDEIERVEKTLDDVEPLLGNVEPILRPTGDDVDLMIDVSLERVEQVEGAGHAANERNHVDAKAGLQRRGLPKVVEDNLWVCVALERDDEPGVITRRFVVDVADTVEFAIVDELSDLAGDRPRRYLVGQFGDDDRLGLALLLDLDLGSHLHRTTAGSVRRLDADTTEDLPTGREVGTPHMLHEVIDRRFGVAEQVGDRGAHLVEVVGRDVRGHADRDALHTVDQQVREPARQNRRLLELGRIVVREIDGVLVDIGQHLHRQWAEPTFGVSIRCGRIFRRAVVAVERDQRVTERERLRHAS